MINNIFNFKISNVETNGQINYGNSLQKGFTADEKSVGGLSIIGDASVSVNGSANNVNDPDVVDQPSTQV